MTKEINVMNRVMMLLSTTFSTFIIAVRLTSSIESDFQVNTNNIPACIIAREIENHSNQCNSSKSQTCSTFGNEYNNIDKLPRLIVIGDVHGSGIGLRELLDASNITSSTDNSLGCRWTPQNDAGTILVQVGDIVDRGPEASEAWSCLDDLQDTAYLVNNNTKVIRLLGNHELWWLEGHFHQRNPTADTSEKVLKLINAMKKSIIDGRVVGAYVHRIFDQPLMFIHAGFRPKYLDYLTRILSSENSSPENMASHINNLLIEQTRQCTTEDGEFKECSYVDEAFEAGPDRGGKGIGGPFWTDYQVIEEAAEVATKSKIVPNMIQIVGHTMAWCYDPRNPGIHPPKEQAECSLGLIRAASQLAAVCVDGGMYAGARAYLEIGSDGRFRSYQRNGDVNTTWVVKDLTQSTCSI